MRVGHQGRWYKTHRRVSILLLERDDGPDLSELVDQLLTDWISKQS